MAGSAHLEIRKDFTGEVHYASRNSNDLRQVHDRTDCNRANVDWTLTLRQGRKNLPHNGSESLPNLHTADLRPTKEHEQHPEGVFHDNMTRTVGKYQNTGNSQHMIQGLTRVSSGTSGTINWQLNLRDGHHAQPDQQWRRYFTRSQVSFDMAKENCGPDNKDYHNINEEDLHRSRITPQDRRPDRNSGAVLVANLRADPISFRRWPGCEGTDVGQWRHLIEDRQRGHKSKRSLAHETTLRETPGDQSGARICDNRSQGCLVEMLGKKKWQGATDNDPFHSRPYRGDPKLHYLSTHRILPEADEDDRALRKTKRQLRRDVNIPETRPQLSQRSPQK